MPDYVPSYVYETYGPSANAPALDKVVFTIDHIHMGGAGLYSTFDVVKYLVKKKIPVTVFMECTDPVNLCQIDKIRAKQIYELDPDLVTLGTHSLPKGNSQEDQAERQRLINDVIKDITGSKAVVLSYHGKGAGPEPNIKYENMKYARGIKSWVAAQKPNRLDTPVMGLWKVDSSFRYTSLRNQAGLTATLFVHSFELKHSLPQKKVFDAFIKQVEDRRLQAVEYYSAMEQDYAYSRCPLRRFTGGFLSQNLYQGHVDGSGPVYQVAELQSFLNSLGYNAGNIDGTFGVKTTMAVLSYQVDNNLRVDGRVGDNTRKSINAFCD